MEKYIPRLFSAPDQSFFLFGPRGTGKSTFLRKHFPDALWIDLLKPDQFRRFSAKPEILIELVHANQEKREIVIDEIQKVPELLPAIHSLIEEILDRKFILTGSSARKLKRSGVDLLAGRVLRKTLHPFMLIELKNYIFENILNHGLLPIVLASQTPHEVLDTYISLYIQQEVQFEGLTRNIGNFSRFLEAASFSHASILNISNIARECEVERKVVENYISILEDILIAFKLPVFTKKAKRATVSHPKFYFFDSGVFYTLRPKGPLDYPQEISGAALEGLVAQHLRAWNAYKGNPFQIYYWRSRNGVEVDFVLYGASGIYAFEVKNSNRIRSVDLRSLTEFRKDYPQSKAIFLYRGDERRLVNDIWCIPCEDFLKKLSPDQDIPI
ncbi:ATPase [bacterium SM23_57]|jgi:predicted AAA+ superfamily ATPase|nr:MAG: ATPase [bacterium SM23_57]